MGISVDLLLRANLSFFITIIHFPNYFVERDEINKSGSLTIQIWTESHHSHGVLCFTTNTLTAFLNNFFFVFLLTVSVNWTMNCVTSMLNPQKAPEQDLEINF